MKLQTVYVPVSKQPEYLKDWVLLRHGELDKNYTTTLEEQSNRIVLAEEELKELVESAWKKGMKSFVVHVGAKKLMDDNDATNINKDLNDFIQSKLKP